MSQPSDLLQIVAAFVVVLALLVLIRRWYSRFRFGLVGLVLLVVPTALSFFDGRVHWHVPVLVILGILLLAADLTGRLRRRD